MCMDDVLVYVSFFVNYISVFITISSGQIQGSLINGPNLQITIKISSFLALLFLVD